MATLETLIDGHCHSEFSWDAPEGSMGESCRRAQELGLGGIAFTEHADLTDLVVPDGASVPAGWQRHVEHHTVRLPALDVEPYLDSVAECRRHHPGLTILSGVEISEPHRHSAEVAKLLARGHFDRVISSVHAVPVKTGACDVSMWFGQRPADEVIRAYLQEVLEMIEAVDVAVLAHIDFAARYWPAGEGPCEPTRWEREYRGALAALAERAGALEINTRRPLDAIVVEWWVQEGGRQVTFGSDAHAPATVGKGLAQAMALATDAGFRPAGTPAAPWRRRG